MQKVLLGVVLLIIAAPAQDTAQPTCSRCSAAHIKNDELQAYVKRLAPNTSSDQQVRAVDVGKSNVGIGIVHRGRLIPGPNPRPVAVHDQVSEIYHVIDGSATLMTGSDLVDSQPRPADNDAVRLRNGPGRIAANIRNGTAHELKAGDVLIIPAGVGHWFTTIDDHIDYLMIRVDPDKITPQKTEEDSKNELAAAQAAGSGQR